MITDQDINRIVDRIEDRLMDRFAPIFSTFATKEDLVPIRADIAELKHQVGGIYTVLDTHTMMLDDLQMEYHSMMQQLARHERWHHQVAAKTGTILTYDE